MQHSVVCKWLSVVSTVILEGAAGPIESKEVVSYRWLVIGGWYLHIHMDILWILQGYALQDDTLCCNTRRVCHCAARLTLGLSNKNKQAFFYCIRPASHSEGVQRPKNPCSMLVETVLLDPSRLCPSG